METEETPAEYVIKLKGKVVLDCIANGLTIEDALTLAELSEEEFNNYRSTNPRFSQLVERKKVEYKQILMTPITTAIKDGDSKLATWMLERKFNEEYSSKRKPTPELTNPINIIINQIQSGELGSPIVPPSVREIVLDTQTIRETEITNGQNN